MFTEQDHHWMQHALTLAATARDRAEVPVGAVLVADNALIGEGFNQPITNCDPTAHAEIIALRAGANTRDNYRLLNTTLYVTLEPCIMCLGAIVHARVQRLVFGAYDAKSGAVVSAFQILDANKLNHQVKYAGGLLSETCGKMLSDFFSARRIKASA
jgi:tRNA(adenine34) deaminase